MLQARPLVALWHVHTVCPDALGSAASLGDILARTLHPSLGGTAACPHHVPGSHGAQRGAAHIPAQHPHPTGTAATSGTGGQRAAQGHVSAGRAHVGPQEPSGRRGGVGGGGEADSCLISQARAGGDGKFPGAAGGTAAHFLLCTARIPLGPDPQRCASVPRLGPCCRPRGCRRRWGPRGAPPATPPCCSGG